MGTQAARLQLRNTVPTKEGNAYADGLSRLVNNKCEKQEENDPPNRPNATLFTPKAVRGRQHLPAGERQADEQEDEVADSVIYEDTPPVLAPATTSREKTAQLKKRLLEQVSQGSQEPDRDATSPSNEQSRATATAPPRQIFRNSARSERPP